MLDLFGCVVEFWSLSCQDEASTIAAAALMGQFWVLVGPSGLRIALWARPAQPKAQNPK